MYECATTKRAENYMVQEALRSQGPSKKLVSGLHAKPIQKKNNHEPDTESKTRINSPLLISTLVNV